MWIDVFCPVKRFAIKRKTKGEVQEERKKWKEEE